MKRRLVKPIDRLRLRAEASAAQAERVRQRLDRERAIAAADARTYEAAQQAAGARRARRDAERQMRGQS